MERPAGAMPSPPCDAGQDRRLTRTIFRDGAAGPDDLNRVHEEGVSGRARTRVHRSSDQREPGLARSRTPGKVCRWPMRQAQTCKCRTESPIRTRPLHRLRRSRRTTQRRDTAFRATDKALMIPSGAVGADSNVGPRFAFDPLAIPSWPMQRFGAGLLDIATSRRLWRTARQKHPSPAGCPAMHNSGE